MKKLFGLVLTGTMLLTMAACGGDDADPGKVSPAPSADAPVVSEEVTAAPDSGNTAAPDPSAPVTQFYYSSDVEELEGGWSLSQVYANGESYDAVENAASFNITLTLDPSELVDQAAYTHNQVCNLTGELTFGVASIQEVLDADELDGYRGSTSWSDFPQGKVMAEGKPYQQPGPATMRFQDVDAYGMFLDQLAEGAPADVETTSRNLILGINNQGQLLLGVSEEHLERPGETGEWTYCLIFDKAA